MATYVPAKRATEYIFYVGLVSQSDTKILQSNPTLAAGDVQVSKDGGALANLTTLPAVTPASSKMVKVTLSATEMTADNVTVIFSDAAGAQWCDLIINIQTAARQIDDLAYPNVSGRGMDVDATGGVEITAGQSVNVATDGITATSIATGAIDADALAADAVAEIADGVWDEDATGHQTQGSFGQVLGDSGADTDSVWSLANTNLDATVSSRATQTSVDNVQSDTDNIQTRLPAALVGGRMDSDVGNMQANTVNASALASDAVTELRSLVSGTADSGSTTTMVDAARTEADTDYWAGDIILFTSGTLSGQARVITAFDPATDTITFTPATTQAVTTHTYEILPGARAILAGLTHTDAVIPTVSTLTGHTPQTGDSFARLGAPAGASVSADIAAIEAQTDDIGAAGAGLTAIPWSAAWDAEVQSEVQDAIEANNLDHLAGTATGIPAVPAGTYLDQIMDDGTAAYDRTTDSLQAIRDRGDAAWTTGGGGSITDILNTVPLIPQSIDLANTATWRLALMLTNALDDLPSAAEITPGTISIDRKAISAATWSAVVTDAACSEAAGVVYFDEVFDSASGYAEGDSIRITFKSQKITVAANDYEISDVTGRIFYTEIRQTERGTDSAALASSLTTIEGKIDTIDMNVDSILADTGTDGVVLAADAISASKIAADAVTEIQSGLATSAEIDALPTATENADELLKRDLSLVTGEASRSVLNAIRFLRNKWTLSGTTVTVTKEDDTTTAWTGAVTTDAAADPITGVDPS